MKNKILIAIALLLSLNTSCFAYYDVPLYATVQPLNRLVPESQPLDLGKRAREISEEGYRNFQLNAINDAAHAATLNRESSRRTPIEYNSQPVVNPNRSYVIDKPLSLKGIYPYDAYGR